jgi:hypothetical protein
VAKGSNPVLTCDKNGSPLRGDYLAKSGCEGGPAYSCTNHSPWRVSENLSYGFAAVKLAGGSEQTWCCACYELTFTSGPVKGKRMIVQATNTGYDLKDNHFDIAVSSFYVFHLNKNVLQHKDTWWRRWSLQWM